MDYNTWSKSFDKIDKVKIDQTSVKWVRTDRDSDVGAMAKIKIRDKT